MNSNIKAIFNQTALKRKDYLLKSIDEVLDLFAFLYTENDKVKARNILDRKREVSDGQLVEVSMFTGAALA